MGTYSASLRALGDSTGLPATVELEDGQLTIAAGSHEIGTWALSDIELEPLSNGYRMAAEGEQIIIELKELDAFREALANGRFKRRFGLVGKQRRKAASKATKTPDARTPARAPEPHTPTRTEPTSRQPKADRESRVEQGLTLVDKWLARAHKRFGPYLPDWVFSRAMVFILMPTIAVMLVFPGIFSTLLLITGGVVVALGAVTYSDPMLASRWLPGRTQPPHVLIIGVVVLVIGVLIGILAG